MRQRFKGSFIEKQVASRQLVAGLRHSTNASLGSSRCVSRRKQTGTKKGSGTRAKTQDLQLKVSCAAGGGQRANKHWHRIASLLSSQNLEPRLCTVFTHMQVQQQGDGFAAPETASPFCWWLAAAFILASIATAAHCAGPSTPVPSQCLQVTTPVPRQRLHLHSSASGRQVCDTVMRPADPLARAKRHGWEHTLHTRYPVLHCQLPRATTAMLTPNNAT
jgi:hypothetical protein